jgi:DNA-binding NarL/FixJ family response regulator|tara:strand:- start:8051 stop:8224 length:174 start_codon:yes stop_codon:yes gene_type:complete
LDGVKIGAMTSAGGAGDDPTWRSMMILELHRQGLSMTAIARRTGHDPNTIRKYGHLE